jgi:protein phosphatase
MTQAESADSRSAPYLWVTGLGCEALTPGERVGDRYEVITPQIWQDTQGAPPPAMADVVPDQVLPYLKSHPHRLHLPGVYDVILRGNEAPWLVLENAPINPRSGKLYPALADAWGSAPAVRQLSWLWQWWQLWQPLMALGVARSLLSPTNVRVEGWRLRLRDLQGDGGTAPSLADLAERWRSLQAEAQPAIAQPFVNLCSAMASGDCTPEQITVDLNYLLLKEAAQRPIRLRVAGATHPGPNQTRNEDACYPDGVAPESPMPRIAIVCDGVGGHEAGEVASQLAVRSLQLQLQGLVAETDSPDGLAPPQVIAQQIEAAIRVVNDLVNRQNDQQNRSDRQRMGTTLVMALVVPQRLKTEQGWLAVNELYIAHVGDSRAYWITPDYCHQLTVDDDIASREVQAGRQFYSAMGQRSDAGSLTQAIGTRSADFLTPHVQRFVLDEEGVLLLCSDGLSDHGRIEAAWGNYIGLIIKDIVTLDAAVAAWVELANQKNGHDNVSVVLMQCKQLFSQGYETIPEAEAEPEAEPAADDLTDASRALLYSEEPEGDVPTPATSTGKTPVTWSGRWVGVIAIGILLLAGLLGWWIAGRIAPPPTPEEAIESPE